MWCHCDCIENCKYCYLNESWNIDSECNKTTWCQKNSKGQIWSKFSNYQIFKQHDLPNLMFLANNF